MGTNYYDYTYRIDTLIWEFRYPDSRLWNRGVSWKVRVHCTPECVWLGASVQGFRDDMANTLYTLECSDWQTHYIHLSVVTDKHIIYTIAIINCLISWWWFCYYLTSNITDWLKLKTKSLIGLNLCCKVTDWFQLCYNLDAHWLSWQKITSHVVISYL